MERSPISPARAAALCAAAVLALGACSTAPPPEAEGLAVGAVQREIKVGMKQASVLEALGAPHRVSTDSQRREVWTYDEISSDRVDTDSSVGGGIIVRGGGESPVASATQRTLTLIIYYDDEKRVREFAYNYSSP